MDIEDASDTKYCSNCKRDIAAHSFQIHEAHCHRHIVLCPTCDEPVPRTQLEEHFEENHIEAPCDMCGQRMAKDQLDEHKEEYCPERMISCKHCELEVKAIDFQEHIAACGSRTDLCDKCLQRVMLRDMESHQKHGCIKPHPPGTNPFRSQLPLVGGNRPQPVLMDRFTGANQPTVVSTSGATGTNRSTTAVSMGGAANISIGGLHFSQKQNQTNRVKPYIRDPNIPSTSRPIGSYNIGGISRGQPMVNLDGGVVNTSPVQVAEPRQEGGRFQYPRTEQPARQVVVPGSVKSSEPQCVKENKEYQLLDDEELARKLQEEFNQENTIVAHHTTLARQLITDDDDESPYYKKVRPDDPYNDIHTPPTNAQLEENERRPDDPFSSDDEDILTKQLQQEERHGTRGLSTMLLFEREMEKSHEDEERQQQIEQDKDLARRLLEEEESKRFLSSQELPPTPPPYPHLRIPNEPIVPELSGQDLLTQQLELEEYHGSRGLPTMVLYNKEMTKAQEEEEKRQRLEEDLELAKQLQEEEDRETRRKFNAIYSPPQEAPPPSPSPSPTHSPPPYRHVGTHHELREEPEDETPPINNLHEENNYIPCELCGERILFEMFSIHLDERHPQFSDVFDAHRQTHLSHSSIPQERHRPNPTIPAVATTTVINNIPCRYCGFKYAPTTMTYHETICDQNPDKNLSSIYSSKPLPQPDRPVTPPLENDLLPCQFCNAQFSLLVFDDHQNNCPDRFLSHNIDIGGDYGIYGSNLPSSTNKDLMGAATTDVVDEIPCEKCQKSFPMKEFHKHEATCQYQKPKQSSLPRHNPSSRISTSSDTTGGIFSTSTTYRLSPSPDPPVSKAKIPRQRIQLAAQFPESKTKSDTLLGTTNQLLTTKPIPKPRTLTNRGTMSKGGAVLQERLGSDIQRDGKQPLLPSKTCTGNKLSETPKTRSSSYSSDTRTTATKVKSSTNTNQTRDISHVTRGGAGRGKCRDHDKEEEQYGLFVERADDDEEEDMEIDQDYTMDTMESNITTEPTITRFRAHSFSSTTSSGQYPMDTKKRVTSRDDLLSGELSHLSVSGTKIGSPSNGRPLRSNPGSHTTALGFRPQKTGRTSHNGLSNNPPGRRPHRGGGASGTSGNYSFSSLPSSYQYNNRGSQY